MDTPFDVADWQATRPPEIGEEDITGQVPALVSKLIAQTQHIYQFPYEPHGWFARCKTLSQLRYPELAVGDSYKAVVLCQKLLERLHENGQWRLGSRMAFWMLDDQGVNEAISAPAASATRCTAIADDIGELREGEVQSGERDDLEQRLLDMKAEAHQSNYTHLEYYLGVQEGQYRQRLYPWMQSRHRRRSDELLAEIRNEFASTESNIQKAFPLERSGEKGVPSAGIIATYCTVNRHAFGISNTPNKDSSEVFGVFATRDVPNGTKIVVDETETWGCIGPGTDGSLSNLHGGGGCSDPIHPNVPSDYVAHDLRWIRDRAGKRAAEVILRCRFLMCCIRDGQSGADGRSSVNAHPLDHSLIARLTPNYRREKIRFFSLEHDITIPNEHLLRHGVDIFATPEYDTWVLFTLYARIENNSWGDPIHACISPLFSLFNHSCEPNVDWKVLPDHTSMAIRVVKDVAAGEQLFVNYDGYLNDQPLAARRKRMRKWLNDECQCTKCLREEAKERCTCGCGGRQVESRSWDIDDLPVFPEDSEVKQRVWR